MGWAKANIMFELCRELPEQGTPTEIMFLLLWRMRQDIELAKQRAMIQALIGQEGAEQEKTSKAFDDLREAFFPFDKKERGHEIKKAREYLLREISKGPLSVTPMIDLDLKKNAGKLSRGAARMAQKAELTKQGSLQNIDAQTRARQGRRTRSAS